MNANAAASAYKSSSFENAPPLKIVHLMYEGALRFIDQAGDADPSANSSEFVDKTHRALTVVAELRLSLDSDRAPELCEHLETLYLFVEAKLQEAMVDRDVAPLLAAREVLGTLFEAWRELAVEAPAPPSASEAFEGSA